MEEELFLHFNCIFAEMSRSNGLRKHAANYDGFVCKRLQNRECPNFAVKTCKMKRKNVDKHGKK